MEPQLTTARQTGKPCGSRPRSTGQGRERQRCAATAVHSPIEQPLLVGFCHRYARRGIEYLFSELVSLTQDWASRSVPSISTPAGVSAGARYTTQYLGCEGAADGAGGAVGGALCAWPVCVTSHHKSICWNGLLAVTAVPPARSNRGK
jgi:hypothetical protein